MAGDRGEESEGEKEERQGVGLKGRNAGEGERLSDIPKNGSRSP